MLKVYVPETELYDEINETFVTVKAAELHLEHSLVSISKWEAKWRKPFLDAKNTKTIEESRDYIRCMTMNQNVNPRVYYALTPKNFSDIDAYINDSLTATWFNNSSTASPTREIITSELIYYQMISFGIPMECQKWHFSRLLTLIRICSIKNSAGKKMSKGEILRSNRALNAARRKASHSRG